MEIKKTWWKKFINRLSYRYRFVVLNDETYQEKASFLLSRLNVILAVSTIVVINIIFTSLVIIYTPLKQYIPGYGDYGMRKQIKKLINETEDLTAKVQTNERWAGNVRMVLSGGIPPDKIYHEPKIDNKGSEVDVNHSSKKRRN